jgi:hypothetical protein
MKECITCNGHGWLLTDEVKPCPDCWIPGEPEGGSGWLDDDDSPLPIALRRAAGNVENPSEVFTPTLTFDADDWSRDQWRALYGPDMVIGVAGFGKTREEALADFNAQWRKFVRDRYSTESQ